MGRALDQGGGFDLPAQAFLGQHDVQRCPLALELHGRVFERNTDRELAGSREFARLGAGVDVLADVLVQFIHKLPALLLAEGLQPGTHIQKTGTRGRRVGHHDLALVFRLGQVLPTHRFAQPLLLRLDGVEANGRGPHVHPHPGRRVGRVAVVGADLGQVLGGVALQHALLVENRQAGGGQAPHCIGLRASFFSQQLGSDDAGGVTYPFDLDIRVGLLESLLVGFQLLGF